MVGRGEEERRTEGGKGKERREGGREGGRGRGREERKKGEKKQTDRRSSHVYSLPFLACRLLGGLVFTLEPITNDHETIQHFNHTCTRTRPSELKPLPIPELSQKF